jgi:hypothetical protein
MIEIIRTIREGLDVRPWIFVVTSGCLGFVLFATVGWLIDRAYQRSIRPPSMPLAQAATAQLPPALSTKPQPHLAKTARHGDTPVKKEPPKGRPNINQTSNAPYSPNVVTGDQSTVTITNPPPNPYGATATWDYNGMQRLQAPGVIRGVVGNEVGAFQTLRQLQSEGNWEALLKFSNEQMAQSPSWPTPYLFAAEANAQVGSLALAKQELATVERTVSNNPGYAAHIQRVKQLILTKESEQR